MKLGLIQCDYVPTLLQSSFKDYPVMFEKAFNQCDPNLDWTVIDICGGNHDVDVQDFDGFIISGSRSSVNDPKLWIEELLNLIRRIIEREVPLVGLCFGHQAIAKSLGGLVSKSKTGWNIGCVPVELTAAGKSILNVAQHSYLYAFHQDNVETLPDNARLIGSTEICENFIVEFKKGVIGFQGHPEFFSDFSRALFQLRRAGYPPKVYEAAMASLEQTSDQYRVAKLMIDFCLASQ